MNSKALLIMPISIVLIGMGGCADQNALDPVSSWQRLTGTAGGAAALEDVRRADEIGNDGAYHNRLVAESFRKCDVYRRSLSVTQRATSSGLAWGAASAGALGLAFTPAGIATLAAFTAGGSILASAAATVSSTSYAGLTPQTIEQRLRRNYSDAMEDIAKNVTVTNLARIASVHSRCSLSYLLGENTD